MRFLNWGWEGGGWVVLDWGCGFLSSLRWVPQLRQGVGDPQLRAIIAESNMKEARPTSAVLGHVKQTKMIKLEMTFSNPPSVASNIQTGCELPLKGSNHRCPFGGIDGPGRCE